MLMASRRRGVPRRWSGGVNRMSSAPLVPVMRALNEPHHLLGIDLRGDADSE
jgi:hypothetical protein